MNAPSWIAAATAFAIVVVCAPVVKALCLRFGLVDSPGALKIHSRPVPRLGGAAILFAIVASTWLAPHSAFISTFLAALGLIGLAGLVDDIRGLPVAARLAAQLAAAFLLWHGGYRLPWAGTGALALMTACLFVVAFINAFNFLDGADGVAAGVAAVIAAAYLSLPTGWQSPPGMFTAVAVLGASAAFLLPNFPPASLFMGDSGSTVLGFCVVFLALDFYGARGASGANLYFPVQVAALPFLDALLAVVRRLRNAQSPFRGDRRHFYDLLLARGWPPRRVAISCYAIAMAFAVAARLGLQMRPVAGGWIFAISAGIFLLAALRLGSLRRTEAGSEDAPGRLRRVRKDGPRSAAAAFLR